MNLHVKMRGDRAALDWGAGARHASIGPGGIAIKGGEGDGITPRGRFPVREIFYRADRIAKPKVQLPLRAIAETDGWCDAPNDPNYNRLVTLPYPASAERLWRDDGVYDIVVVLGHNDDPPVPGLGSAIFLHLCRPGFPPTEGCIAIERPELEDLHATARPGDAVAIRAV